MNEESVFVESAEEAAQRMNKLLAVKDKEIKRLRAAIAKAIVDLPWGRVYVVKNLKDALKDAHKP